MKLTLLSAFVFSASTMVMVAFEAKIFCIFSQDLKPCVDSLVNRPNKDITITPGNTVTSYLSSKTLSYSEFDSIFDSSPCGTVAKCARSYCS